MLPFFGKMPATGRYSSLKAQRRRRSGSDPRGGPPASAPRFFSQRLESPLGMEGESFQPLRKKANLPKKKNDQGLIKVESNLIQL